MQAKDLYGQRIGTVLGDRFLANRVKPPLEFQSVKELSGSLHVRILLITDRGIFYSPTCTIERIPTPRDGSFWRVKARPLVLEESFTISDAVIYDFVNQERCRPVQAKLPMACERGETKIFTFHVRAN